MKFWSLKKWDPTLFTYWKFKKYMQRWSNHPFVIAGPQEGLKIWGANIIWRAESPLVEIGLTDLPKSGGAPLGTTPLHWQSLLAFALKKISENSNSCSQIFQIKFSILIHCVKDENCSKCLHSYTCLVWLDSMHIYNAVHFMGGKKISTIYILAYKVLLIKSFVGHFL